MPARFCQFLHDFLADDGTFLPFIRQILGHSINYSYLANSLDFKRNHTNMKAIRLWALAGCFGLLASCAPQKEEKKMRENLQVGDEIVTIGGIYGRVISLKEDTIVIESVSDHSKITIARWALQTNLTVHDDTPVK